MNIFNKRKYKSNIKEYYPRHKKYIFTFQELKYNTIKSILHIYSVQNG